MGELNIEKNRELSEEDDEKIWEEVIKDAYTDNILIIKTRMVIVSHNTKETVGKVSLFEQTSK